MSYLSWSGPNPPPSPVPPKFSRSYLKSCLCLKGSWQGQSDKVAWHHSLVAISLGTCELAAICSVLPPPPPISLAADQNMREVRIWAESSAVSCLSLPVQICRETDKNTIKSSRYVYAFSFPHYNRFRRITCKNFCTVLQSYVTLQFPILVNNHQHYSLQ